MEQSDFVWDGTSELILRDLLVGRALLLRGLVVLPDYGELRLGFEIAPPLDPWPDSATEEERSALYPGNAWGVIGTDDVGTEYEDTGGA